MNSASGNGDKSTTTKGAHVNIWTTQLQSYFTLEQVVCNWKCQFKVIFEVFGRGKSENSVSVLPALPKDVSYSVLLNLSLLLTNPLYYERRNFNPKKIVCPNHKIYDASLYKFEFQSIYWILFLKFHLKSIEICEAKL